MATPRQRSGGRSRAIATTTTVVVASLNYLGWLGWDQHKDFHPATSSYTGPYEAWQVVGLVVVLGALAVIVGRHQQPWAVTIAATVVMTVCTGIDWMTDTTPDASFAPIAVAMVAVCTFGSMLAVSMLSSAVNPPTRTRS